MTDDDSVSARKDFLYKQTGNFLLFSSALARVYSLGQNSANVSARRR